MIDAVGVDAEHAHEGPAMKEAQQNAEQNEQDLQEIAPETKPESGLAPAPDVAPSARTASTSRYSLIWCAREPLTPPKS